MLSTQDHYKMQPCDEPAETIPKQFRTSAYNNSNTLQHASTETRLNGRKFDPAVFSVLKVDPEDFASQLTLLDIAVFKKIQPDELSSCSWNRKEKLSTAPNVVAFTHRFNQVCLWCQKEILANGNVKLRAEVLGHFCRVAKKLFDLNNLHSAFAIISGLQSSAIWRLSATWALISGKEKASFEKLSKLFSESNNFEKLREHLNSTKAPCVPYLGLYLTDLVYIDIAHPTSGALGKSQRDLQMNNILRVLADFQQSNYSHLPFIDCVQNYLSSVRYIDELQKFVEEENYKSSLELEPYHAHGMVEREDNLSVVQKTQSLTPQIAQAKFRPSHRKTQSLGTTEAFRQLKLRSSANETFPSLSNHRTCLLDDSVIDGESHVSSSDSADKSQDYRKLTVANVVFDAKQAGEDSDEESELQFSVATWNTMKLRKKSSSQKFRNDDKRRNSFAYRLSDEADSSRNSYGRFVADKRTLGTKQQALTSRLSDPCLGLNFDFRSFTLEGPAKRKVLLKQGRRPTISSWTKYWIALWESNLLYFLPRSLPSRDSRTAYKKKPSKMLSLKNWMVVLGDDPFHPGTFLLQEPSAGNVYKFRLDSHALAVQWTNSLKEACKPQKHVPDLLMSFD